MIPLTVVGGGNFLITPNFALSIYIPLTYILCLSTMPFVIMICHFSKFKTKLVSTHIFKIMFRLCKHVSNGEPNIEKSHMKTSMHFSIILEKIVCMQRWKVAGSLHNRKGHSFVRKNSKRTY